VRLLVDTSILIGLLNPRLHKLDATILGVLADPRAHVHASVASLWEIAIKVRLRKLALGIPLEWLPSDLDRIGLTLIPIDHHHVLEHRFHESCHNGGIPLEFPDSI
jgi:PIN domain nuclease of toxin-antitoxin system